MFKRNSNEGGGCPGSSMQQWPEKSETKNSTETGNHSAAESQLRQWPIQLTLVPPTAPYFQNADLVVVADCVPFAFADFHNEFLKGRPIVVGCPKLDDLQSYVEKLTDIYRANNLKSVEVLLMEVPCCGGIGQAAQIARQQAGVEVPIKITTIGVRGEVLGSIDF